MSEPLYDALEFLFSSHRNRCEPDQVLNEYPEIRDDLQPLLDTAILARRANTGDVPEDVMNRSRTQALTHAAALRADKDKPIGAFGRLPRLATALLLVLVLIMTSSSLIVASAKSLPGDQLYPVKRVVENVRLGITVDISAHQEIEANFQERRLSEVQQLISLQRQEGVSFDAQVRQKGDSRWLVGDIIVVLTPETTIIGEIFPGMVVEVEGFTQPEGWVVAEEIHLRNFKITGVVELITPDLWVISGEEIHINSDSQIDPGIQVGHRVVVQIRSTDDGIFYAHSVMIENLMPTITPKPILTPMEVYENDELGEIGDELEEDDDDDFYDSDDLDETEEPDEVDDPEEPDDHEESEETDEFDDDETDEPDEPDDPDETDEPDDPED